MSTTKVIVKMATSGIGFRWLDLLEKEFDKACVELDTSLVDLDPEEPEAVLNARQKIATLSSCFAQLTHKALSIFQNSAKLEAELVDMRAELIQARAACSAGQDGGDAAGNELEATRARVEAAQLARENASLRETVLALHSELFGARLATKYLDKELAGRIQQLQLLGRDMRAELRDSLWAQVEAEILLQRHKTLVRVCRGLAPRPPRPARSPRPARPRTVRVKRSPHLGLGISVTGGREHGVPVLISELEAGGPAALTGELYVGDAILAIDDVDLTQACHKEAVQALQSVKGDCALCVQFIATDDDDHLSDDNYRFPLYPEDVEVFGGEQDGSGATPTAPRTPDYNNRARSEANSGSECESPRYEDQYRPQPPYRPQQPPYPDYNSINNNLSILDMDDDSIKIEAQVEGIRLQTPPGSPLLVRERARHRQRGQYRGLPADTSSADSPHSTPVHGRRPSLKKKRVKPLDWRSKGTYKAVDDDVHSSDDIRTSPCEDSLVNGHGISTVFDKPPSEPSLVTNVSLKEDSSPISQESMISDLSAPQLELVQISAAQLPAITPTTNNHPMVQHVSNNIPQPLVPLPPHQEVMIPPLMKSKLSFPNGIEKAEKASKSKAFRIGSAKRVLDAAPLPNGTHHVEKHSYPAQLVGDGDPDFGTPV